jgi:hypothetical protein
MILYVDKIIKDQQVLWTYFYVSICRHFNGILFHLIAYYKALKYPIKQNKYAIELFASGHNELYRWLQLYLFSQFLNQSTNPVAANIGAGIFQKRIDFVPSGLISVISLAVDFHRPPSLPAYFI